MSGAPTEIRRLRIRRRPGVDDDPSGAVARRLAALDLVPSAIPPSAVLCIRRLADPAPGTLRLDDPDDRSGSGWAGALAGAVDALARTAARPADGPVPAGAQAVVFRDRTELLACLAESAARPGAAADWWWPGLVRGIAGDVAAAWFRERALVPGALDLLERRGTLGGAISTLGGPDARRLAATLAEDAGLPAVARAAAGTSVDAGLGPRAGDGQGMPDDPGSMVSGGRGAGRLDAAVATLADLRGVEPAGAVLAAIGLAIHRRPDLARDAGFAAVVGRIGGGTTVVTRLSPPAPAPAPDAMAFVPGDTTPASVQVPGRAQHAPGTAAPARAGSTAPPAPDGTSARPPTIAADAHAGRSDRGLAPADAPPGPAPSPASGPEPVDVTLDAGPLVEPVVTGLGGMFYLLVLASSLGLCGDFTRPRDRGIGLDPWDLVALLATELGAVDDAPDDPAWGLLARLAGRGEGTRAGAGWRPPPTWRVDPAWLVPFGNGRAWAWGRHGARVRVEHPAGFAVLDARHPAGPVRDAGAVRRALGGMGEGVVVRRGRVDPPRRPHAAERWVAELAAYVRARLRVSLGTNHDAAIRRLVVRHRALVFVGPGTCDIELSLAELPVAIRAAGLDRDLGWVPAARRDVRFHFR